MDQRNSSVQRQTIAPVSWDANAKIFSIVLSGSGDTLVGHSVQATWKPPFTYVVRIRETNSGEWSFGYETPLTSCSFVDLKPDTDYEVEVRSKNDQGVSEPARIRVRTSPEGMLQV